MTGGYLAIGCESTRTDGFDFVFSTHRDYVFNLVHALLDNKQDAEDVTQDVFIRVYKALPSYEPERASMRTWLTRMAINACQSYRRRNFLRNLLSRPASPPTEDDIASEPVDGSLLGAPEDHVVRNETRQTVKDVLNTLRPEHRTILVLHYYQDVSCAEIARILDCPEGTVYSRLHYARRLVQSQLERRAKRQTNEVGL